MVEVDDVGEHDHDPARARSWPAIHLPRSLVPEGVVPSEELAESLLRTGHWVAANGLGEIDPDDSAAAGMAAVRALLLRRPPDAGQGPGAPLRRAGETALEAATRIALTAPGGILPIQGPPGSGKTYTGRA